MRKPTTIPPDADVAAYVESWQRWIKATFALREARAAMDAATAEAFAPPVWASCLACGSAFRVAEARR